MSEGVDAMNDERPVVPEIVPSDPFRDYALSMRQQWMRVYEEIKDEHPEMTLDDFLSFAMPSMPARKVWMQ